MSAERPLTCSPPRKQRRPQSREAPQCLAPSTRGRGGVQALGVFRAASCPRPSLVLPWALGRLPPPLARTHCRPSPDPGPLWSRCVRAQVPGFGAICQHSPLFLSKALSATSLRSHLASKVHMPKRLKTTQSVPSRVAVIRQSQSPSSRFRQGAGKASTLKPPCRGPAPPRAPLGGPRYTHPTWGNPESAEKKANSMSPF